jgi:arginyl-tRNA synthetase
MQVAFHPGEILAQVLCEVASTHPDFGPEFDPVVRSADPRFGDYQANGVLGFAKARRTNPRALGQTLLDAVMASEKLDPTMVSIELAGPGFLNFTLSPAYLGAWLKTFSTEDSFRSGAREAGVAQGKVVVDFSAPNTAKEMHVGHIRSTVIGEAIARLLEFSGAAVVRDNHIGDWGTQFGMIIYAIKQSGFDLDAPHDNPIAELERLYKEGNAAYKTDDATATAVRAELVKLQHGDPENVALWKKITQVSWEAFQGIYDLLGIQFDEVLGESFYRDKVEAVYGEMEKHGLAQVDQGALVVFHPEHPRFATQPFIIRKADGASNYASTDLATIFYRTFEMHADAALYVVDSRQSDHFEQLFLTAKKWYAANAWTLPDLRHISFGSVLGADGKPLKTRDGGSIKLKDLLAEAVERSLAIVTEKNAELPEEERAHIARCVGIGAVRYADLAQNRTSDYLFSWDKMLALEGNTAPYLLYAVARLHSIFRRAEKTPADYAGLEVSAPEGDQEIALAHKLAAFPSALQQALSDYRPHFLCTYLYELAGIFSSFYSAEKVIVEEVEVRDRRLLLCARTLAVLETGLHLLGLETLERM